MTKTNLCCRMYCLLIVLIIVALTAGCTAGVSSKFRESFRDNALLQNALTRGSIAVLPVIVLNRSPENEEINIVNYSETIANANRVAINRILFEKMTSGFPNADIMSPSNVLKRLNDKGFTEDYQNFNREFSNVGFGESVLQLFKGALDTRYLFVSQAIVYQTTTDAAYTFAGYSFGRRTVFRSVKMYSQIWDMDTKKQIWEGSGIGYQRLKAYGTAAFVDDMAGKAVDALVKMMKR